MDHARRSQLLRPLLSFALTTACLASPVTALALLGVGDTGDAALASLVIQGTEAASRSIETIATIRKTYTEVQTYTQIAVSAASAANNMRNFSASRFGAAMRDNWSQAFPDLAFTDQVLKHGVRLDNYSAEYSAAAAACLADKINTGQACSRLMSSVESERWAALIDTMFPDDPNAPATELSDRLLHRRIKELLKRITKQREFYARTSASLAALREKCLGTDAPLNNAAKQALLSDDAKAQLSESCAEAANIATQLATQLQVAEGTLRIDEAELANLFRIRELRAQIAANHAPGIRADQFLQEGRDLARTNSTTIKDSSGWNLAE